MDRGGQHQRWCLAAVAARRQFAIQLVVKLGRTDLNGGRLAAAGIEPLGQVEDLGPLGGTGTCRPRGREGRVGSAAGNPRGVAQQPPVDQLDGRRRPSVGGELLDQQGGVCDHGHILPGGESGRMRTLGMVMGTKALLASSPNRASLQ